MASSSSLGSAKSSSSVSESSGIECCGGREALGDTLVAELSGCGCFDPPISVELQWQEADSLSQEGWVFDGTPLDPEKCNGETELRVEFGCVEGNTWHVSLWCGGGNGATDVQATSCDPFAVEADVEMNTEDCCPFGTPIHVEVTK